MRIILLGPPGAGKGTQAKSLAKQLDLVHISTGDLLRQNVANSTQLGKEAQGYMNKGALVPDELVSQMFKERIQQPDLKNGFILDGYPRNLSQAKTLDNILEKLNADIDFVVYLETSEEVIIQRLSGRLVCSNCGANYHIRNMPPKKDMNCDNCAGPLYQRSDDQEETIRKRLEVYKRQSMPLIQYYDAKKELVRILADAEASKVLESIIRLVRKQDDSSKV